MRPGTVLLLTALAPALLGCASEGFWERPYEVASARSAAPAYAPPPPSRAPRSYAPPAPPPAAAAPAPGPLAASPCDDEDRATLDAVNRIRASRRPALPPFRWNDRLHAAAKDHSAEQRLHGYMGHGSPDLAREDLGDRLRIAGYRGRSWAEVVAKGYPDVPSVVDGWMKSRGHREILLDPSLEEAAFARDGAYWTGNFGTPLAPGPGWAPAARGPGGAPPARPRAVAAPPPAAASVRPPPPPSASG